MTCALVWRRVTAVFALWAWFLTAASAQAEVQAECALVYRKAEPAEIKSMPEHRVELGHTAPPALTATPHFVSVYPYFAVLPLADSRIVIALDESGGSGTGYDRLYCDANNNGDLTDDDVYEVANRIIPDEPSGGPFINYATYDFGIVDVSTKGKVGDPYHFRFWLESGLNGSSFLCAKTAAAGVREGRFTVFDRTFRAVLSDSNMNGIFGELSAIDVPTAKYLAGDLVTAFDETPASEPSTSEPLRPGRFLRIGDRWMELRIEDDAGVLAVSESSAPLGRISFKHAPASLRIGNEAGFLWIQEGCEAEVPAGEYLMIACDFAAPEENGALSFWGDSEAEKRFPSIKVPSNGTVRFPFGPPFASIVHVLGWNAGTKGMAYFDVAFRDRAGLPYHCSLGNRGPDIVIRNRWGKAVERLANERPVSDAIPPPYSWQPEINVKGRFRLSCPLPMFPFEVKARDTIIDWQRPLHFAEFEVIHAPMP
ncbi:MAG: hypothetical protein AMXMBFR82_44710 [Candidatus Hydrogenedentota bacterium]